MTLRLNKATINFGKIVDVTRLTVCKILIFIKIFIPTITENGLSEEYYVVSKDVKRDDDVM